MTTYKGGELPVPDQLDADLKLVGARLPGMENVEEELNLPPEAGTDRIRRPGEKGYMETRPMAEKPPRPVMQPGDLYVAPPSQWSAEAVKHKLQSMSDLDIEMKSKPSQFEYVHEKGGMVQTKDTMPPDQRKLADRINVNEVMQMRDDAKYLGRGTSRDTMPPPPTTEDFAGGGMVKHGSSTRVSCKTKHGG